MPSEQSVPELTTRDVLHQVDRRLTLMEEDVREWRGEMNDGFARLRGEMNDGFTQLRGEMNGNSAQLRGEMNGGFAEMRREMSTRFYWLLGVFFAGWMSMIGTILFKL